MDVRGRRAVMLAGVALFVAVIGLYLSIHELGPWVYGVRLLDGMAAMMWYTALFTHAADLVPAHRRTEGLAIFGISSAPRCATRTQWPRRTAPEHPGHGRTADPAAGLARSVHVLRGGTRALQLHEDLCDHDRNGQRRQLLQRLRRHGGVATDLPGLASGPSRRASHARICHGVLRVWVTGAVAGTDGGARAHRRASLWCRARVHVSPPVQPGGGTRPPTGTRRSDGVLRSEGLEPASERDSADAASAHQLPAAEPWVPSPASRPPPSTAWLRQRGGRGIVTAAATLYSSR